MITFKDQYIERGLEFCESSCHKFANKIDYAKNRGNTIQIPISCVPDIIKNLLELPISNEALRELQAIIDNLTNLKE